MTHQYIHVVVPRDAVDKVIEIGECEGVSLAGISAPKGPVRTVSFLSANKAQQKLLDDLQRELHDTEDWRIAISPLDALVSKKDEDEEKEDDAEISETREELFALPFIVVPQLFVITAWGLKPQCIESID